MLMEKKIFWCTLTRIEKFVIISCEFKIFLKHVISGNRLTTNLISALL